MDVQNERVVKGVRFESLKDAGDPVELAMYYDREGADELVFLDIAASAEGRGAIIDVVRRTAENIFIPLTVGGGINSVDTMEVLLQNGADKVSINTAALEDPTLINRGAERFGSQCIVGAVDVRREDNARSTPLWEVYSHGGKYATGRDGLKWVQEVYRRGAGEILLTSMDADGTKEGYDLELLRTVSRKVPLPVIASGGAGTLEHIKEAFIRGEAHAILLASILHFGTYRVSDIKRFLLSQGLPVRPVTSYNKY